MTCIEDNSAAPRVCIQACGSLKLTPGASGGARKSVPDRLQEMMTHFLYKLLLVIIPAFVIGTNKPYPSVATEWTAQCNEITGGISYPYAYSISGTSTKTVDNYQPYYGPSWTFTTSDPGTT